MRNVFHNKLVLCLRKQNKDLHLKLPEHKYCFVFKKYIWCLTNKIHCIISTMIIINCIIGTNICFCYLYTHIIDSHLIFIIVIMRHVCT